MDTKGDKMKKITLLIISTLMLFGCSSKNCPKPAKASQLQEVVVYEFGQKRIYYMDPTERAIKAGSRFTIKSGATSGFAVLYPSPSKKERIIATNRLILKLPSKDAIAQVEKEYGLKYIRAINERVGLYLFEAPKSNNLFELSNKLNLSGIKAKIDYYAPYKLY